MSVLVSRNMCEYAYYPVYVPYLQDRSACYSSRSLYPCADYGTDYLELVFLLAPFQVSAFVGGRERAMRS